MNALIIQGGGFRTAYTSGVLDVFLKNNFNSFDIYAGVSGGGNALSYYLANQPGDCIESIRVLYEDSIPKLNRLIKTGTILDVDFFWDIVQKHVPLDLDYIEKTHGNKRTTLVLTDRRTGKPHYFLPTKETWVDGCIASCTLPFVSKGKHVIQNSEYMDGSWSDPLPVKWTIAQGATNILILRTAPVDLKEAASIPDRLAAIYFRKNEALRTIFANNHKNYNDTIDFIGSNPEGVTIQQIAPESPLASGGIKKLKESIESDYLLGVLAGEKFMSENQLGQTSS